MSEPHVVSALRAKRAEIAGYIQDHQKRLYALRDRLAHIDATIRIFSPKLDPETIAPKATFRRCRYFKPHEFGRLVQDALRRVQGPITTVEVTRAILEAKGYPVHDPWISKSAHRKAVEYLRKLRARGDVERVGLACQNAKWRLPPD